MKKKQQAIIITVIIELAFLARILYLWEYGWGNYGAYTLLKIIYVLIGMVATFAIVSVIIDRRQSRWQQREIDEHAYEVSRLNKKLKKYNPDWIREGNTYTRKQDPDWREDKNMIKAYLIRFKNVPASKTNVDIGEWCYWLGYHRAKLQQRQEKEAEEAFIYEQGEDIKNEQMTNECLEYINEIYPSEEQEEIPDVFRASGNLEEDIKALLKMGVQGKDVAEVLHTSPAKVSRVKKKMEVA